MVEQKLNQRCLAPAGSFSFIQRPPEHIAAVVMVGEGNGWEGAWKTRSKPVRDYEVESFRKGTVIAAPEGEHIDLAGVEGHLLLHNCSGFSISETMEMQTLLFL